LQFDHRHPGLRIGLSSGAFYPQVPTEEIPAIAAEYGISDLELLLQTAGEYQPPFIQQTRRVVNACQCRVFAVHSFQELVPVFSLYRRRAEEARTMFSRMIEATVELGANVLVWHGPRRQDVAAAGDWERFIAVTAELVADCASAGITLAIENVSWCALATVREVTAFTARLPEIGHPEAIGFAFDPFQAAEAGANPFMILQAMEDRVVDVHLSDYRAGEPTRHLPPGQGELPWPALIRAIAGVYSGPMMIEAGLGSEPHTLLSVIDFLTPLIAQATSAQSECDGPLPPGVLEGIRLFNDRQFYECHEEIEHEWHAERGEIRRLYQGILQIGVGFHHARAGNHRGAVLLLTDGIEKTAGFLPACRGVDTARLVRESQACLDQIIALGPDRLSEFDWDSVPLVHLAEK
jgi:sugar phosphate isomerase/epimerase/predicted metal-dependent hydrolase